MNALVAYFSASGVTKKVAENLNEATGADIFEIKPKVAYTAEDLDWRNENSRSSVEMKNKSIRPEISETIDNAADYDVIFLGFPIWWYVAPTIVNTFLESCDFSNKTIVLFEKSGSSGIGKSAEELKPSVADSTIIKEGKILNSGISKEELSAWVDSLGL